MRMPTSFSQQHACDIYTSTLGNTFAQNIQALANHPISQYMEVFANNTTSFRNTSYGSTTKGTEMYDTARTLNGVQDSLTSMLDNVLLTFSSAQLMISSDTYAVPVSTSSRAVRIGQSGYIYAAATVHFAIVLLSVREMIRTRGWKGLSRFDFTDVRSLVVGTAEGGTTIAEEAEKIRVNHAIGEDGDGSEDRALGSIRVRLESLGANLRLVGLGQKDEDFEL